MYSSKCGSVSTELLI